MANNAALPGQTLAAAIEPEGWNSVIHHLQDGISRQESGNRTIAAVMSCAQPRRALCPAGRGALLGALLSECLEIRCCPFSQLLCTQPQEFFKLVHFERILGRNGLLVQSLRFHIVFLQILAGDFGAE